MRIICLSLLVACGSDSARPDANPGFDAATDAFLGTCVGTYKRVCADPAPAQPFDVQTLTSLDTSSDASCDQIIPQGGGAPALCVKYAASITISSQLFLTGTRPFVLAAVGDITVADTGFVDASSPNGNGLLGPAGNDPSCAFAGAPGTAQFGAGGGAGGTFAGQGGNGGSSTLGPAAGGLASTTVVTAFPDVRGGCGGDTGGAATGQTGGAGGRSGGAVVLVAGGTISIAGAVVANGEGGNGGGLFSGGGGGGSAGLIVLDAPTIDVAGRVTANGGGGGGGGNGQNGGEGGRSGAPDANHAMGGAGAAVQGGAGGSGSTPGPGGNGANAQQGAGGGGGSTGAILLFQDTTPGAGTISPPATTP